MRTYCDQHGNPDPNGDFERTSDGAITLRNGRMVSFALAFMDSAHRHPGKGNPMLQLTDAQQCEVSVATARARMMHDQAQASKPERDRTPWTDAMGKQAAADAAALISAKAVRDAAQAASYQPAYDAATIAAQTARRDMINDLGASNGAEVRDLARLSQYN